jgi:hypothetical protein
VVDVHGGAVAVDDERRAVYAEEVGDVAVAVELIGELFVDAAPYSTTRVFLRTGRVV